MNIKYIVDHKALAIRALKKAFCAQVFRKQPIRDLRTTIQNFNYTQFDEQAMDWGVELLKRVSTLPDRGEYYRYVTPAHSAAMPLLNAVSEKTNSPVVTKDEDSIRWYNRTEFPMYMHTWRNLMVSDVLNSGKTCLRAIWDIRSAGVRCIDLGVLFDTQQGGLEYLKDKGINVYRVLTIDEIRELMAEIRTQPDVPPEAYLPKPERPIYDFKGCWCMRNVD